MSLFLSFNHRYKTCNYEASIQMNLSLSVANFRSAGTYQRRVFAAETRRCVAPNFIRQLKGQVPPIYLSTNPLDQNAEQIGVLLKATNQNCCLFPETTEDGSIKPVNTNKLKLALRHSTVVVSAYCVPAASEWLLNLANVKTLPKRLVGFGRAVSDSAFTASIHDIAVAPSLQRLGIGRRIVQRIIRILKSHGIDDVSVLCCNKQRPFFEAMGFADDVLKSTTMIYSGSSLSSGKKMHFKN